MKKKRWKVINSLTITSLSALLIASTVGVGLTAKYATSSASTLNSNNTQNKSSTATNLYTKPVQNGLSVAKSNFVSAADTNKTYILINPQTNVSSFNIFSEILTNYFVNSDVSTYNSILTNSANTVFTTSFANDNNKVIAANFSAYNAYSANGMMTVYTLKLTFNSEITSTDFTNNASASDLQGNTGVWECIDTSSITNYTATLAFAVNNDTASNFTGTLFNLDNNTILTSATMMNLLFKTSVSPNGLFELTSSTTTLKLNSLSLNASATGLALNFTTQNNSASLNLYNGTTPYNDGLTIPLSDNLSKLFPSTEITDVSYRGTGSGFQQINTAQTALANGVSYINAKNEQFFVLNAQQLFQNIYLTNSYVDNSVIVSGYKNYVFFNALANILFGKDSPIRITGVTLTHNPQQLQGSKLNYSAYYISKISIINTNLTSGEKWLNPFANSANAPLLKSNTANINLSATLGYFQFLVTNLINNEQVTSPQTPAAQLASTPNQGTGTQLTATSPQFQINKYEQEATSFNLTGTVSYSGNSTNAAEVSVSYKGETYNGYLYIYSLGENNVGSFTNTDDNINLKLDTTFTYTQFYNTNPPSFVPTSFLAEGYYGQATDTSTGTTYELFLQLDVNNAIGAAITQGQITPFTNSASTIDTNLSLAGTALDWKNYLANNNNLSALSYNLVNYFYTLFEHTAGLEQLFQVLFTPSNNTTTINSVEDLFNSFLSVLKEGGSLWTFQINTANTSAATGTTITYNVTLNYGTQTNSGAFSNLTSVYSLGNNNTFIAESGAMSYVYGFFTPKNYATNLTLTNFVSALKNLTYSNVYTSNYADYLTTLFINADLTFSSGAMLTDFVILNFTINTNTNTIDSLTFLLNNQWYYLNANINLSYGQTDNGVLINYANVTDASNFQNWLNTWTNTTNYIINSSTFSDLSSLTLSSQNATYLANNYLTVTGVENAVFTHSMATGYFASVDWCNWKTLSSFLSTLYNASISAKISGGLFANITNLTINGLPLNVDANTALLALTTWFPNLKTLQIVNCGLTGTFNLQTALAANNKIALENLNLDINDLTGLILANGLTAVSAANNQISNLSTAENGNTYNLMTPTNYLNLSDNDLTSLPALTFTNETLPIVLNLSNNNLTTVNLVQLTPAEAFTANDLPVPANNATATAAGTANYLYQLNLDNNNLVNLAFTNVPTYTWTANKTNNWTFTTSNSLTFNLSYQSQNAETVCLINNVSANNELTNAYQPLNDAISSVNNPFESSAPNTNLGLDLSAFNDKFANATIPGYLATTNSVAAGLISQTNYENLLSNTDSILNNIETNSNNGLWMLNADSLKNALLTITNNNYSASITYNDLIANYGGIIPYNAYCLAMLLENNSSNLLNNFQTLKNIFAENFSLMSQQLVSSNINNWTNALTSNGYDMTTFGTAGNYLAVDKKGDVVIYNKSTGACYAVYAETLAVSNSAFAHLTINNADSYLHINLLNVNTPTTSTINLNTNNLDLENVNNVSLNNITSLDGTSGFYNLSLGGVITPIATNPFSMGANAQLWNNFLNINYGNNLTLSSALQTLSVDGTPTINQVANYFKNESSSIYQNFENNFYKLLQEEGIIPYQQTYSIYGNYLKNDFTFSQAFLNSDLTFAAVDTAANWNYGMNNNAGLYSSVVYPNTQDVSSFYQTSVWANFINTKLSTGLTIGETLYDEGNWDYQMPSYNNAVFNNSTAKTAYTNLLNLYGLKSNLSASEFNNAIATDFPLNNTNSAFNLFRLFVYNDGLITNAYSLYTNTKNGSVIALSLNYLNIFQNIANNAKNYLYRLTVYGTGLFNNDNLFNNVSNLIMQKTTHLQTNTTNGANSWTALETAEAENLIPLAVYDNTNVIGGTNSASWVPLTNYNQIIQQENHDKFVSALAYGLIFSLILAGALSYGVYALAKHLRKKTEKSARELNLENKKKAKLANELPTIDATENW